LRRYAAVRINNEQFDGEASDVVGVAAVVGLYTLNPVDP
jgi:hypothetical protein